jgi:hypothetical protein
MATFYSDACAASWQGNYFARGAGNNGPTWVTYETTVTAAQAVANNIFNLCKLDRHTIVLDGYMYAEGLDVNASTTATVDLGFLSDADGDGDTDVIDFFVDGAVLPTLTGGVTVNFDTNDLGTTGPFIPVDTLTSTGANNGGYFISAKLLGTVATAGDGLIKVGLLIANKNASSSAAE